VIEVSTATPTRDALRLAKSAIKAGLVMFALVGGPFRAENGCGCPLTPLLYGPFEVVV
jgi:hypothetical protein